MELAGKSFKLEKKDGEDIEFDRHKSHIPKKFFFKSMNTSQS